MTDSKIALLLNTNSLIGVQLIRKVAQLDYDIISVEIADTDTNDDKAYDYLAELPFTNPELKDRFQKISVKPNSDETYDYFAILDKIEQILNDRKSLDLIIDINTTDPKSLQLWDLKLILALFQKKLISSSDSTVIIGNCNYNSNSESTALDALHNSVTKISRDLSNSNIRCIDFTQINSLPGDESYIVETYTAEILRNAFKVQKLHSLVDFVKFIIYAYFPNFLISPIFFLLTLLNLDKFQKQKTD
ncbi:hypothetical protein CANINC_000668 [Pichia inconspicua]|uniref:Uncharacterized protein n=1 Tax=Pichia inconspicua TaxID=52247 RepID=A0A4T0X6V8_9ASCO|nr:hypothetical protein CANINC_000668 [[Candida] inconspicua]